ncbi:MAG: acetyltransferase [Bacteroidia bacterium]|nr:acetyltransferase [Bacteroidia bacterium]
MMEQVYHIIGRGGLFSIIRQIMQSQAKYAGYYDDRSADTPDYLGSIQEIDLKALTSYFIAIGGEPNMLFRGKLLSMLRDKQKTGLNCVSPKAHIYNNARVGGGNIIMPFAHIGSQCTIGDGNILYSGVIIEHDSVLGNNINIAPGVKTGGSCVINDNVFLGIGSTLKDGITIGEGALIGAGSLVLKDVPPHTIAYGSPAKVIGANTIYRTV